MFVGVLAFSKEQTSDVKKGENHYTKNSFPYELCCKNESILSNSRTGNNTDKQNWYSFHNVVTQRRTFETSSPQIKKCLFYFWQGCWMPVCSLLLVQVFYDPFSEADSHTGVEMNTKLHSFLINLSPLKNVLLVPKTVCGNTVADMWECIWDPLSSPGASGTAGAGCWSSSSTARVLLWLCPSANTASNVRGWKNGLKADVYSSANHSTLPSHLTWSTQGYNSSCCEADIANRSDELSPKINHFTPGKIKWD